MPEASELYMTDSARLGLERKRNRERKAGESLGRVLDNPDGLAFVAAQLRGLGLLAHVAGGEAAIDRHNRAADLFRACARARPRAALDIVRNMIRDWNS